MKRTHSHLVGMSEIRYCDCDEPYAYEPIYYRVNTTLTAIKYVLLAVVTGAVIGCGYWIFKWLWFLVS